MLLGYIWLLGTFVNSSCDIKINVNIVQNCCRNLAVRGLIYYPILSGKSLYLNKNIYIHEYMHALILYMGVCLTQYILNTLQAVLYIYGIIKPKNRLTLARGWVIDIIGITRNTSDLYYRD